MCTYVYLSIKRDVCVPVERSDPATMQSGRKMKSQSPGPTPESQLLVLPQVFRKKTNSARIDACYFKISKILLHFPCKYSITIDTSVSLVSWMYDLCSCAGSYAQKDLMLGLMFFCHCLGTPDNYWTMDYAFSFSTYTSCRWSLS